MKAILEIELPGSCAECPIKQSPLPTTSRYFCGHTLKDVRITDDERPSFCQLKIVSDDFELNCGCGLCLAHNDNKCPKMPDKNAE